MMVVLPRWMTEPSRSWACRTCWSSTTIPLVEPRSEITEGTPTRISACRRETEGSSIRRSTSVPRPRLVTHAVDLDPAVARARLLLRGRIAAHLVRRAEARLRRRGAEGLLRRGRRRCGRAHRRVARLLRRGVARGLLRIAGHLHDAGQR